MIHEFKWNSDEQTCKSGSPDVGDSIGIRLKTFFFFFFFFATKFTRLSNILELTFQTKLFAFRRKVTHVN